MLASLRLNSIGAPVLIDSGFLRSLNGGQVDLCFLASNGVKVVEVKSGRLIGPVQLSRLRNSSKILSLVLDTSTVLYLYDSGAKELINL